MTSPVWVVSAVSLFVPNKRLRLTAGTATVLSGLFILALGAASYFYGLSPPTFADRYGDSGRAAEVARSLRQHAAQELLLFEALGALPLLLGGVALALSVRMSPEKKT
jgi:hypothetical protein